MLLSFYSYKPISISADKAIRSMKIGKEDIVAIFSCCFLVPYYYFNNEVIKNSFYPLGLDIFTYAGILTIIKGKFMMSLIKICILTKKNNGLYIFFYRKYLCRTRNKMGLNIHINRNKIFMKSFQTVD